MLDRAAPARRLGDLIDDRAMQAGNATALCLAERSALKGNLTEAEIRRRIRLCCDESGMVSQPSDSFAAIWARTLIGW